MYVFIVVFGERGEGSSVKKVLDNRKASIEFIENHPHCKGFVKESPNVWSDSSGIDYARIEMHKLES